MNRVAVAVLAAGGSSRVGRPKQLLPFCGRSLLRHTVEVALAADCGPVLAVLGAGADQLRPELEGLPVDVAVNRAWELGPGTSVRTAVDAVEPNPDVAALVFVLCDQPLVGAEHIRQLIEAPRAAGLPMAASGYAGTLGVPALFDRDCFLARRAAFSRNRESPDAPSAGLSEGVADDGVALAGGRLQPRAVADRHPPVLGGDESRRLQ